MQDPDIARKELEHSVLMAARDTVIASVFFRNAMGHRIGLNISDYEALSYIGIRSVVSPSELARYTGLTAGSTTAMLDRLESAGFISRKPNPKDRRGTLIEANPQNQGKAKALVVGVQQAHRELLASCTESELQAVLTFLEGFAKNVTEATAIIEQD